MFKKFWEWCYAPTKEQQKIIEDLWNNSDHKTRMAIAKFGGHMYAEGWKEKFLPFVGAGLITGYMIGRHR